MILKYVVRPGDSQDEIRNKSLFVPMIFVAIVLSAIVAVVQYLALGPVQAILPLILGGMFVLILILLILTGSMALCHGLAFTSLLFLPLGNQWALGGFMATGGIGIWGVGGPFAGTIFRSKKEAFFQFSLYLIAFAATILAEKHYPSTWPAVPESLSSYFLIGNLSVFLMYIMLNVLHFRYQRDVAQEALNREHSLLQQEQNRSEKLLLNVLPPRIAQRLKTEPGPIAEAFDNVCVIFADIANFTPLAARTSPERLVSILNEIFYRFDDIAEKHGLEKIKTLGDAYMAAAGLPDPVDRPAHRCAKAALDMQAALESLKFDEAPGIELRIGIHCGPVVAGVIGRKKFIYDLWGDAVNVASRMESHGSAGRIHLSDAAATLLANEFQMEARGPIEVKGKGSMQTFFLSGAAET